jgi:hypothetical protein
MFSLKRIIMGLIVIFAVIQLIPVNRTNPAEPDPIVFTNPQAEALAKRACYACHANTNAWDWYAYVAPVSWIYVDHVNEGRQALNFSDIAASIANSGDGGEGMVTRAHAEEENEENGSEAGSTGGQGSAAELIDEVAESMQNGEMPPSYFYLTHYADATLTSEEQTILLQGMRDALAGR